MEVIRLSDFLVGKFSAASKDTLLAQSESKIISSTPRLVVEPFLITIGLLGIAYTGGEKGFAQSLPVLGMAVFALQRFMPYVQSAFSGWTYVKTNELLVKDFLLRISKNRRVRGFSQKNFQPRSGGRLELY